ncbi:class I SAM-dependent methyltransferase [Halobacterium bonnevillei]|uniref:Methyltransferase domain-containing protein n=1 Tax=Halobacterium bonnevillei TaxID=2692200 RepID=A0A6B0SGF9_9EURY|nr:class I SAM-dependent methyltransferase family protein [Halobacterium bonnevillei]MXR20678.1 methyltransferase domain-containing protein [Halobacterium bonnevillei]
MPVPCVRVPVEDGEATRQRLADADLLVDEYAITHEDGSLYIPVSDPDTVPEDLAVVDYDAPERETPTTPADILGFEPTCERLGDVVILDEDDPERARDVADAVMASDVRAKTVVNRASKVKGTERVRDWDVLAGDGTASSEASRGSEDERRESSGTETVHTEYGCEFELDLAEVYFSPRLATERHRVVEQVAVGEHAFDMFAGVGPYAIPMAEAGATVVATDINETAVEYLRRNARRNDVADRVTAIAGDVRETASEYADWADRIVMNLPHTADEFLDTAVALAGDDCVIHYYDFQHENDLFGPGEAAIRDAAEPAYDVTIENTRTVRSYAPHELNVVLDARLTRQ